MSKERRLAAKQVLNDILEGLCLYDYSSAEYNEALGTLIAALEDPPEPFQFDCTKCVYRRTSNEQV
jgi:hypothetical protein